MYYSCNLDIQVKITYTFPTKKKNLQGVTDGVTQNHIAAPRASFLTLLITNLHTRFYIMSYLPIKHTLQHSKHAILKNKP